MAENLDVAKIWRELLVAPEIGPKRFGTFEKQALDPFVVMTALLHDGAHSLCVSESRYATADVIAYKNIQKFDWESWVFLVAFETYRGRHHMFFANQIK